jgi:UDP-GlcNAc3NAcA epimerase
VRKFQIVTIVGARPQFIKAAVLSRAIAARNATAGDVRVNESLVHTGQHYDKGMSQVFFDELELPEPDANLGVGPGPHGMQTGRMLERVEACLLKFRPDAVVVYGDTNSTLAGALAASKLHLPLFHVEAGLRSGQRSMPEEINRILTDHMSDLLFCPSRKAVDNLRAEGVERGVHLVGDIMKDSARLALERIGERPPRLDEHGLVSGEYFLTTLHRAENTDSPDRLRGILDILAVIARSTPVALVLHPRTRSRMEAFQIPPPEELTLVPPVSYLAMIGLMHHALGVITDSGGLQKEAYFLKRPCMTLREETEWPETVEIGANFLAGHDPGRMMEWHAGVKGVESSFPPDTELYGDGHAAEKILEIMVNNHAR